MGHRNSKPHNGPGHADRNCDDDGGDHHNRHNHHDHGPDVRDLGDQVQRLPPQVAALKFLPQVQTQPRVLAPQIRPHLAHGTEHYIQDIHVPIKRRIVQPIIQPVVYQERPVIDRHVIRRIHPELVEEVVPEYRTMQVQSPRALPVYRPVHIDEEVLPPRIHLSQVSPHHHHDCDYDDEDEDYGYENYYHM